MNNSEKMGIGYKLAILSVLSLVGMLISLVIFIHSIENSLYKEKKTQTQILIESGMAIIDHYYNLEVNGQLASVEAKKSVIDRLKIVTFGETGYFWINDTNGIILMNPNTPELVGKNVNDTVDINGTYPFREFIKTAMNGGGWVEYYWPRPNTTEALRKLSYVSHFKPWDWVLGTGLYLDDIEQEIRNTAINGVLMISVIFILLILTSILLSNRFLKQLRDIAIHDSLTALHTRRYLFESIPIFLSKHERNMENYLSVIFFDIDHFKDINDRYGHALGDNVLANIGATIKSIIRKSDLGIRYGGEEFLVVMLSDSKDDVIQVAERIREQSHQLVFGECNNNINITLSAGVSFREEGEDFESMIKRADENLYKAKNSGRDRLIF
jgi:methyl-accepting chemotaxis protein